MKERYVSPLTGYVHKCFEDPTSKETIPIYENFLYAYDLFLTKQVEAMLKARELLVKLFYFQTEEGAFPLYIHEYPSIRKKHLNVNIFSLLKKVEMQCSLALGAEGKQSIKKGIEKLKGFLEKEDLPPSLEALFQAALGKKLSIPKDLVTSKQYIDVIEALFFHPFPLNVPFDVELKRYAGALYNEEQLGYRPKTDTWPDVKDHYMLPAIVKGAGYTWHQKKEKGLLLTYIEHFQSEETMLPIGFHILRVASKDHTFVSQELTHHVDTEYIKGQLEMTFTYPEKEWGDDKDEKELSFFIECLPKVDIFVEGKKATTFSLQEKIDIVSKEMHLQISLVLLEGEGRFLGHISRGNRRSQTSMDTKKNYAAYDYKISLRTLQRTSHVKIRLFLRACLISLIG